MNATSITPGVVKIIRSAYGMSAVDFAEHTGLSVSALTQWESGITSKKRNATIRTAIINTINEDVIAGAIAIHMNAVQQ